MHAAHVIGDGPVPSSSTNSQSTQLGGPQPLTARSANRDRTTAGHGGGNGLAGPDESASGLLPVSTAHGVDFRNATYPDGHWVESQCARRGRLETRAGMRHTCCPEVATGSPPEIYQLDTKADAGTYVC